MDNSRFVESFLKRIFADSFIIDNSGFISEGRETTSYLKLYGRNLTLSLILVSLLFVVPQVAASRTAHDPIYIEGNSDFSDGDDDGVINPGATGTENDPYIIENWAIDISESDGIKIKDTTVYFVVRNCLLENGKWSNNITIWLDNVVNGRIDNNICENSDHEGIGIYNSYNNVFSNNTCQYNEDGIYLYASDNNILSNNTCWNNSNDGIFLDGDNNILSNNTCQNNASDGVFIWFSDNNTISNNTCRNNYYGIFLSSSANNDFFNNTCQNNGYGIYIYYNSDGNFIYHNNFMTNDNQAYDECSNYWDNGYPSGGNYWSDYSGEDNYKDENQGVPGSDGIGDTPYSISGGTNQDSYPLMEPWSVGEESRSINLSAGWNCVGFPFSGEDATLAGLFGGNLRSVLYWDAVGGSYGIPSVSDPVVLGVGYWIELKNDQTVTVP